MKTAVFILICITLVCASRPDAAAQSPAKVAPNKLSRAAAQALVRSEHDPYWLEARESVVDDVLPSIPERQDQLARAIARRTVSGGNRDKKLIALTFDDGPHYAYTQELLEILKTYDVPATFFVVGEQAEKYPDMVREEIADGDEVGNHTYDHVSLPKLSAEDAATEIKACGEVVERITGRAPHLFRPPGGDYTAKDAEEAEALGYEIVLWSDDPGDYASPGVDLIVSRTIDKIRPGGIILLHDGIQQTLDALPQILDYLRDNGYRCVTVDELMKSSPPLADAHSWNIAKADGLERANE